MNDIALKSMRIGIIGAGAMGSLFAAHLADAGADIRVFDRWRDHIEAIQCNGLTIRRNGSDRTVHFQAATDASALGICDVVIVMVKYHQTKSMVEDALPMIGPATFIVTLQNGLGNAEIITSLCPVAPIVIGLTTLTSELLGPGRIEASYASRGETYLWPVDGKPSPAVERLCALMTAGGMDAMPDPAIELRIWKKLIVNCCFNTMCAITGLPVGKLTDQSECWPLLDGIVDEIVATASAKGIPLDRDTARKFLRQVGGEARDHYPSMLIDVRNRRRTEIECLNGAVTREAASLGIETPLNRALYYTIRIIEDAYKGGSS